MKGILGGKIILITGSSRGIGAATARLAKKYGATVVLHGKNESTELRKLASTLNAEFVVCDVADEKFVKKIIAKVLAKFGKIDILVNCAGITEGRSFLELTTKDWTDVLNTNLIGTFYFCQAVAPGMLKQKYGRIVNISSVRGTNMGRPGSIPYAASKAAVINFTQVLAKTLAPHITVNSVAPGPVEIEGSREWPKDLVKEFVAASLMKRLTPMDAIAEAVLFLASDKASFITGQTIVVDGGYSISGK